MAEAGARVLQALYECRECHASIPESGLDAHVDWHERLNELLHNIGQSVAGGERVAVLPWPDVPGAPVPRTDAGL